VVNGALIGVCVVGCFYGILGGYLGVARCLGACQGFSMVFWVVTRALLGVCVVARLFLWYSGWLLGCC